MKQAFIFGMVACILLSCASKDKKQPANISPEQKREKSLSINSVSQAQFVLSFSFLQSSTMNQKEIDKLYKETEKSNPSFIHPSFREHNQDFTDIILKRDILKD